MGGGGAWIDGVDHFLMCCLILFSAFELSSDGRGEVQIKMRACSSTISNQRILIFVVQSVERWGGPETSPAPCLPSFCCPGSTLLGRHYPPSEAHPQTRPSGAMARSRSTSEIDMHPSLIFRCCTRRRRQTTMTRNRRHQHIPNSRRSLIDHSPPHCMRRSTRPGT